jgi:hypothetical protein
MSRFVISPNNQCIPSGRVQAPADFLFVPLQLTMFSNPLLAKETRTIDEMFSVSIDRGQDTVACTTAVIYVAVALQVVAAKPPLQFRQVI